MKTWMKFTTALVFAAAITSACSTPPAPTETGEEVAVSQEELNYRDCVQQISTDAGQADYVAWAAALRACLEDKIAEAVDAGWSLPPLPPPPALDAGFPNVPPFDAGFPNIPNLDAGSWSQSCSISVICTQDGCKCGSGPKEGQTCTSTDCGTICLTCE
jgi:hypothetical protein